MLANPITLLYASRYVDGRCIDMYLLSLEKYTITDDKTQRNKHMTRIIKL